jgi:hypothetical protein
MTTTLETMPAPTGPIEDGAGVTAWSSDVPAEEIEEAERLYGDGPGKGGGVRILVEDDGENG